MKKITYLLCIVLSFLNLAHSQEKTTDDGYLFGKKKITATNEFIRCASTEYEEYLKGKDPKRASNTEFEKWLQPILSQEKSNQKTGSTLQRTTAVITIPVVVHVIHNGDNIGIDENIFDEQVASQIRVLNEDFRRRLNSPGFNTNPVGADVEIEFVLAKRDPQGVLTNGINRVNLGEESWSTTDIDDTVKPETIWNPDQYFNIWVVNFTRDNLLGYAQFPSNSNLPGLNSNAGLANTDGVVLGYKYFGSRAYFPNGTYGSPYDGGRTASHEVGHWLGLRHIWGDGGCDVDDFCADTPNAGQENEGCPVNVDSCPDSPGLDMVENYMDYTNDRCMNIFTQDQKSRMITIMNNSPRRASLITSNALQPGIVFDTDAAVRIFNINLNSCSNSFAPTIEITNKGKNPIIKANIRYAIDNTNFQTAQFTGNIAPNTSQLVTIKTLTSTSGSHTFNVELTTINNIEDQKKTDNIASNTFTITRNYAGTNVTFRLQRDDYGSETSWKLTNTSGTVLYQGGPYTDNAASQLPEPILLNFTLANNECYTFIIEDSIGDGICCDYGNGSYSLNAASGQLIASGGSFSSQETTSFKIGESSSGLDFSLQNIKVYPNPASDHININLVKPEDIPDSYSIINAVGQVLETKEIGLQSDLKVSVSTLSAGYYFLKLSKNGLAPKTLPFIKN